MNIKWMAQCNVIYNIIHGIDNKNIIIYFINILLLNANYF